MEDTVHRGGVAHRAVRAGLAAAAIGVIATVFVALVSEVWAGADPALWTNPGPIGTVETFSW